MPLPADEGENRSPINFAKLSKRSLRLLFISSRVGAGQNDAPARRQKLILKLSVRSVIWFHRFLNASRFHRSYRKLGHEVLKILN